MTLEDLRAAVAGIAAEAALAVLEAVLGHSRAQVIGAAGEAKPRA